jgi:hypothetical protein
MKNLSVNKKKNMVVTAESRKPKDLQFSKTCKYPPLSHSSWKVRQQICECGSSQAPGRRWHWGATAWCWCRARVWRTRRSPGPRSIAHLKKAGPWERRQQQQEKQEQHI